MFIDGGGVWRVVELLFVKVLGFELCVGVWKVFYELNFRVVDEVVVNWVFVIDMFNFFFWLEYDEYKCLVGYRGSMYSGYWFLCVVVNRVFDEGWCFFFGLDLIVFVVLVYWEGVEEWVGRWNSVLIR